MGGRRTGREKNRWGAAQVLSTGVQTLGDGTCIASLAGSEAKRAELSTRIFQDKFHQRDCPKKLCARDMSNGRH